MNVKSDYQKYAFTLQTNNFVCKTGNIPYLLEFKVQARAPRDKKLHELNDKDSELIDITDRVLVTITSEIRLKSQLSRQVVLVV